MVEVVGAACEKEPEGSSRPEGRGHLRDKNKRMPQ